MGKKKNIPKPARAKKTHRIPEQVLQPPRSLGTNDDEYPCFRFTHADKNRWQLSSWTPSEIDDLIKGLKKIERYTWRQIRRHGSKQPGRSVGTGYKLISNHPNLSEDIPEDVKLSEMRIDKTKRIFGFRVEAIYYIVWFDRDHSVCPEN
ncbi:MAG: MAG6450 family protein [Spirulina sp.]